MVPNREFLKTKVVTKLSTVLDYEEDIHEKSAPNSKIPSDNEDEDRQK